MGRLETRACSDACSLLDEPQKPLSRGIYRVRRPVFPHRPGCRAPERYQRPADEMLSGSSPFAQSHIFFIEIHKDKRSKLLPNQAKFWYREVEKRSCGKFSVFEQVLFQWAVPREQDRTLQRSV